MLLWKWTKSWWMGVVCSVNCGNQIRAILCGNANTGPSMTLPRTSRTSGQCPARWKLSSR